MINRDKLIDIVKLFFAINIILIHTSISNIVPNGFYIKNIIFRLGVPFFFISSGFYFYGREKNIKKSIKKILIPFLFWGILYTLIAFFLTEGQSVNYLKDNILRMFTGSFKNVVWYNGSLIYSLIILTKINSKKKLQISILIATLLYLLGLSFTTYANISYNYFQAVYNFLTKVFIQNRSFWFSGYLYTSLGYYLAKYPIKFNKVKCYIILLISLVLIYLESKYISNHLNIIFEYDFFIFQIPAVISLFLIIKNSHLNNRIKFKTNYINKLSINLYYLHFLIIYLIIYINHKFSVINMQSINYSIIVVILTINLAIVLNRINNKHINKLIN